MEERIKADVVVRNLPSYELREFTVFRAIDAELWFYGSYETRERAREVALELGNGIIIDNAKVSD